MKVHPLLEKCGTKGKNLFKKQTNKQKTKRKHNNNNKKMVLMKQVSLYLICILIAEHLEQWKTGKKQ